MIVMMVIKLWCGWVVVLWILLSCRFSVVVVGWWTRYGASNDRRICFDMVKCVCVMLFVSLCVFLRVYVFIAFSFFTSSYFYVSFTIEEIVHTLRFHYDLFLIECKGLYWYLYMCMYVVFNGMRVVYLHSICVDAIKCVLLGLRYMHDVWSPRAISNRTPLPRGVVYMLFLLRSLSLFLSLFVLRFGWLWIEIIALCKSDSSSMLSTLCWAPHSNALTWHRQKPENIPSRSARITGGDDDACMLYMWIECANDGGRQNQPQSTSDGGRINKQKQHNTQLLTTPN